MATLTKTQRQKLISMTLKKKHKLLEDLRLGLVEDNYACEIYDDWLNKRRTNNLDKLHFIISHGILRPELRYVDYAIIIGNINYHPTSALSNNLIDTFSKTFIKGKYNSKSFKNASYFRLRITFQQYI